MASKVRAKRAGRPATTDAADIAEIDEPETGPLRRCAVTRERLPKAAMIRFVVAPDRRVVPDLAATLPGRGIWLSARRDVVETARTRGIFAKASRGPVTISPDFTSGLQAALARRIVDTLGLARRAGQAVSGFTKAREWLSAGRVALVVQASDGSAEECARLMGGRAGSVPVVRPLDRVALGAVFGREQAVHVAVAPGGLAERLAMEAARLAGMTDGAPAGATGTASPASPEGTQDTGG